MLSEKVKVAQNSLNDVERPVLSDLFIGCSEVIDPQLRSIREHSDDAFDGEKLVSKASFRFSSGSTGAQSKHSADERSPSTFVSAANPCGTKSDSLSDNTCDRVNCNCSILLANKPAIFTSSLCHYSNLERQIGNKAVELSTPIPPANRAYGMNSNHSSLRLMDDDLTETDDVPPPLLNPIDVSSLSLADSAIVSDSDSSAAYGWICSSEPATTSAPSTDRDSCLCKGDCFHDMESCDSGSEHPSRYSSEFAINPNNTCLEVPSLKSEINFLLTPPSVDESLQSTSAIMNCNELENDKNSVKLTSDDSTRNEIEFVISDKQHNVVAVENRLEGGGSIINCDSSSNSDATNDGNNLNSCDARNNELQILNQTTLSHTVDPSDSSHLNSSCSSHLSCHNRYRDHSIGHNSDPFDGVDASERESQLELSITHGSSEESFTHQWKSAGMEDVKDQTIARLKEELAALQENLKSKDEKVSHLSEMQESVDREIHELTASLFQEAHKMVTEANTKRVTAEKLLSEANGKVDVLQAEVDALKLLVLTSTPSSSPNKPFGGLRFGSSAKQSSVSHHRRNLSDTPCCANAGEETEEHRLVRRQLEFRDIDPRYHAEFVSWRSGKEDWRSKEHPFLKRIYTEDILPCMSFANAQLAKSILNNIENNTIFVEQLNEERIPTRDCALSKIARFCHYRVKLEGSEENYFISQSCRNRIASICDFFTYLRYINQGLIKTGVNDTYWEIIRLRKNMALARLGLGFVSSSSPQSK